MCYTHNACYNYALRYAISLQDLRRKVLYMKSSLKYIYCRELLEQRLLIIEKLFTCGMAEILVKLFTNSIKIAM